MGSSNLNATGVLNAMKEWTGAVFLAVLLATTASNAATAEVAAEPKTAKKSTGNLSEKQVPADSKVPAPRDKNPPANGAKMDNARLEALLKKKLRKLDGQPGMWWSAAGDWTIYIMTSERANRMRIMIPVAKFKKDTEKAKETAITLLKANYDRALDAKYAINGGVIWSVFLHPLETLSETDLENALKQVATLADNTGTTFSSTELIFTGGAEDDEADDDPPKKKRDKDDDKQA